VLLPWVSIPTRTRLAPPSQIPSHYLSDDICLQDFSFGPLGHSSMHTTQSYGRLAKEKGVCSLKRSEAARMRTSNPPSAPQT